MPIISTIERRTLRGKLLLAGIFTLLSVGGVTMIYPFALMLSGALRSEMDQADLDLVPGYFRDGQVLYQKFLETKYNQDVAALNGAHGTELFSFRGAALSDERSSTAEDFRRFLASELPEHWQILGGTHGVRTVPENLRSIRRYLAESYQGNLEALSRELGAPLTGWNAILVPPPWSFRRSRMAI